MVVPIISALILIILVTIFVVKSNKKTTGTSVGSGGSSEVDTDIKDQDEKPIEK